MPSASSNLDACINTLRDRAVDQEQLGVDFRNLIRSRDDDVVHLSWTVELPGRFEELEELFNHSHLAGFGDDSNQEGYSIPACE